MRRTLITAATLAIAGGATVAQAAAPTASVARGFSGSAGTKSIGTLHVRHDSTLQWRCWGDCTLFAIIGGPRDANYLFISGSGHRGNSQVAAGAYHQVSISSTGRWSFTIR
jgi:hypothetical protein